MQSAILSPLPPGKTLVIYHPHSKIPLKIINTDLPQPLASPNLQLDGMFDSEDDPPYWPFRTLGDFGQTEFFIKNNFSDRQINEQLQLVADHTWSPGIRTHTPECDRALCNHMTVPTVGHPVDRDVHTRRFFVINAYRYRDMKDESPLTFPLEKPPDWLLSTLQSVGSTRISAFKNKITIPSHLKLSAKALEAADQQLKLLGGDRHVFDFSAGDQGTRMNAISKQSRYLCKVIDSAYIILNDLRLHLPSSGIERDARSKWAVRWSKTEPLKKLQATDGNLVVEFERKTCVFQCLCGTDNTVGSHASKKRQIAWEDVGCPAWVRITATAQQDSKSAEHIRSDHVLILLQRMRLLRSTVSKATLSIHQNVKILTLQLGPPGFPSTPTSGSTHFNYFANLFRWRSSMSSAETKQSAYTVTPLVVTPIDSGLSHMTRLQYTGPTPIVSALPNAVALRRTLTSGSGKKLHPPLTLRSLELVSTTTHPLSILPSKLSRAASPSSFPHHPKGKLPGVMDIRSRF